MNDALPGKRIVLDCRWLGLGGAGRVTELLLAELSGSPPPGDWILWGRPGVIEPFAGATVAATEASPRALAAQRSLFAVPRGDVVVYLHQLRPLRRGRSVTVIHDTIPLRHGRNRRLKRRFFRAVARRSSWVLTDSELSKERIVEDLGFPPERISVMSFPADAARARRIAALRAERGQEQRLLYVGRFAPHKNLERLARVFPTTRFARAGGELVLVGGPGAECSEDELDLLLATSRALVLPSLEEGYGLPAFEAVASGLPVAVSRTGAMTSLPAERASFFDPLDEAGMAAAIDEAVAREASAPVAVEGRLAVVVLDAVSQVLAETTA